MENTELKFLTLKDSIQLRNIFNEKLFKEYEMGHYPFKKTDAIKYIKKSNKLRLKKQAYIFGIFLPKTKRLIGVASLHDINWIHKYAEIFCWIEKNVRNKGYGFRAVSKLLQLAFKKYKMNRVEAKLREDNTSSRKVLEKLHFKLEGKLRKKYFNNGRYYDALEYSLLKSEYDKFYSGRKNLL